ncbi:MAG: hypothetical protein EOO77_04690 [Oxalobacteraceae bacterium]|nr:MAG: hypothetical protein EOO77_04690 [Oxalobacteraceae bacterium]
MSASRLAIGASRQAIRASHTLLQVLPAPPTDVVEAEITGISLAGLDADDLNQLVDDFIACYLKSQATGNEADMEVIGSALEIVGRHLAQALGPKEAGVVLN